MKKKLLHIIPFKSSFIRNDSRYLSEEFEVYDYFVDISKKSRLFFGLIKQFFYLLFNLPKYDLVFIQFAGNHSFIPVVLSKLFRKKVAILVGGTDAAYLPSINYGNYRKKILRLTTSFSLKNCNLLLPVDSSLEFQKYIYDRKNPENQGYKSFIKNLKTKSIVVYNGYDTNKFFNKNESRIPNSFITITQSTRNPFFYRKGIDLIISMAKYFNEYSFCIIGYDGFPFDIEIPDNLKLINRLPQEELVNFLNQYEFYFQLSMFEGFPNALCEAMLCGCIPIGSSVSAIPFIIGDSGFILQEKSEEELKKIIEKAVTIDKKHYSKLAENRIKNNFPAERRKKELIAALNSLLS